MNKTLTSKIYNYLYAEHKKGTSSFKVKQVAQATNTPVSDVLMVLKDLWEIQVIVQQSATDFKLTPQSYYKPVNETATMTANEKLAARTWYELLKLRPYLGRLSPAEKKRFAELENIRRKIEGDKYVPYEKL